VRKCGVSNEPPHNHTTLLSLREKERERERERERETQRETERLTVNDA
jgi:hypothetical protein